MADLVSGAGLVGFGLIALNAVGRAVGSSAGLLLKSDRVMRAFGRTDEYVPLRSAEALDLKRQWIDLVSAEVIRVHLKPNSVDASGITLADTLKELYLVSQKTKPTVRDHLDPRTYKRRLVRMVWGDRRTTIQKEVTKAEKFKTSIMYNHFLKAKPGTNAKPLYQSKVALNNAIDELRGMGLIMKKGWGALGFSQSGRYIANQLLGKPQQEFTFEHINSIHKDFRQRFKLYYP